MSDPELVIFFKRLDRFFSGLILICYWAIGSGSAFGWSDPDLIFGCRIHTRVNVGGDPVEGPQHQEREQEAGRRTHLKFSLDVF